MKTFSDRYLACTAVLEKANWLPLLLTRFSIGSIFIISGWGKLHNIPKVAAFFTDLGLPMAEFNAQLVAVTEFGCGTLILLGLLTRLASIPLTITMIVAILTAKISDINNIFDLVAMDEFLYIVFFAFLIVNGAGRLSIDAAISYWRRKKHSG